MLFGVNLQTASAGKCNSFNQFPDSQKLKNKISIPTPFCMLQALKNMKKYNETLLQKQAIVVHHNQHAIHIMSEQMCLDLLCLYCIQITHEFYSLISKINYMGISALDLR